MKKVIYAKYNRTRVPEYQTVTKIVEQDGNKYVVKEALTNDAMSHIASMESKYDRLSLLYKNIKPGKCHDIDEKAVFDYYDGTSIADIIESDMKSLDDVLIKIKNYIDILFQFNVEYVKNFTSDETFENIFGEIKELDGVPAVSGADVDLIFDNVLCVENNRYICIDYEWYMDCLIPISFVKYRTLFYFFAKNHAYFYSKMDVAAFLEYYEIDRKMQSIYRKMDDSFQQMVHGKDWVNIYTRKYEKKVHPIKDLMLQIPDIQGTMAEKDNDIANLKVLISQKDRELIHEKETIEKMKYEYQVLMDRKALMIREKDYEISEYRKVIDDDSEEIKNLRQINSEIKVDLEKSREILEANEERLESISNSISWKITRPIRAITDLIRGKR